MYKVVSFKPLLNPFLPTNLSFENEQDAIDMMLRLSTTESKSISRIDNGIICEYRNYYNKYCIVFGYKMVTPTVKTAINHCNGFYITRNDPSYNESIKNQLINTLQQIS